MSNITPVLNACLQTYNTHCSLRPRTRAATHDEFLKEAYRIATHTTSLLSYLHSIRSAYLSTAPPPPSRPYTKPANASTLSSSKASHILHLANSDRDAIDTNAKMLLRDLNASLRQLADAENLRRRTVRAVQGKKYRRGILARWAAGGETGGVDGDDDAGANRGGKSAEQIVEEGREETLAGVRESVLWFLGRELAKVVKFQREMVERRVKREVERGRSALFSSKEVGKGGDDGSVRGQAGTGLEDGRMQMGRAEGEDGGGRKRGAGKRGLQVAEEEEESRRKIEEQLTPEQLQLFASENRDMLKHYEDTLDQVRTAERSILEISSLQNTLVQNLDIQSANISQLVADSMSTQENVVGGNKELKKASERGSTARMVFWASCALSAVLVGWDLIF